MKHPLKSKTLLWNSLLTAAALGEYAYGTEGLPPGVLLAAGLVNIWLRFITKGPIGRRENDGTTEGGSRGEAA